MKIKFFCPLAFLILGTPVFTYANNPVNDFLLEARADVNDVAVTRLNSSEMNVVGSWIDNAQFRFEAGTPTDNVVFNNNALNYEIRFRPKAWGQRDIEKNIIKLRGQQQNNVYSQLLNSALQKRYFKLLDYLELFNREHYLLRTSELLTQQAELIRSQILSDQFNPEKLLDTEETLQQTQELFDLNLIRLNALQAQLGIPQDSLESFKAHSESDWVVTVSEIHQQTSTEKKANPSSLEVSNAQLKLQLSQSEHQLTEAKQRIGVNLLKFEYSDRRNDSMAFQVGINIPLGTRFSDTENQHQMHIARMQLNASLTETKQVLDEISNAINWLSKDWELLQNQMSRVEKHVQKDYARNNPFLLLNLRKTLIDHQQKKAEINQKALVLYVNYLALSGQLIASPLRNWIQQGTPELLPGKTY